jgi:REP element-mobilizing transposase RayT
MARPLRIEFPGALYHVTSRGNARRRIFLDDADRERFLRFLERVCARFAWLCHAYCLMGNHYHLVLETPGPNLSRGMQQLGSSYAQSFNRCHRRCGHVLQGRYSAILVEKETHLLELARYVVLNPVRAGLCEAAEDWRWSSYRATCGLERPPAFLQVGWLLAQFGSDTEQAQARYTAFVGETAPGRPEGRSPTSLYFGDKDFVRRSAPRPVRDTEFARREREPIQASLAELLAAEQGQALLVAYRVHGYRLREIASCLGVHPSTVCRRLRRAEAAVQCKI